ncbi:cytochrome c oxidase subunit CcoM [Halovibrio sp. HP20-50]|nr:cytochrome c oxidase subunit CcoM [Halovibrio sp. HP20-59]MEA2117308.1 cytochrome c oxidase subunit CcoM [Halovibrio sp. HP20-59]
MYWDDTIIFGLATVALVIAFMVGWVGFVIRDHLRKKDDREK